MNDIVIEAQGSGQYLLSGTLTFASVPRVYDRSKALFEQDGPALTLDLRDIQHTDSAGLALLMEWTRLALRQNQEIQFKNIPAQMLGIARLSGLDSILSLD